MNRTAPTAKTFRIATLALGFAFLFSGCGGGGGSSSVPAPPADLTLSGTAAKGIAISGAAINANCLVGNGTATTMADGTYSLVVTGGQPPCVLEITDPLDGSKSHTVALTSGSAAIANITPLTEMLSARVSGKEPVNLFAAFDSTSAGTITTVTVKAAQVDVGAALAGTIDTSSLADFIGTPLKAATAGNPKGGDAQDKLLDSLGAKLNGAQISQVATALANTPSIANVKSLVANLVAVPPIANAGVSQAVVIGQVVTLDGSASSADVGRTLTYSWSLIVKPPGSAATLSSPTAIKPTFTADLGGTYRANLTVNDGMVNSSAALVEISALNGNIPPVANAGIAKVVIPGILVTLDGTGSFDANADPLTYAWTLTSKPTGSSATLSSATSPTPTFTADLVGSYVASLVVNDGHGNSQVSTVAVFAGYTDNGDGTVTDPTTGLMWMRCPLGLTWNGSTCLGTPSHYTWDQAVAAPGAVSFAGNSDWRLPNIRELESIVNWSGNMPYIDSATFPFDPTLPVGGDDSWSATADANDPTHGWVIRFRIGGGFTGAYLGTNTLPKSSGFQVHLVRAGRALPILNLARPTSDYVDNGDGTATHTPTGLMWTRCATGQTWNGTTCTGTPTGTNGTLTFAGKSDWRIPTLGELRSLVDYTSGPPTLNAAIFPNTFLTFPGPPQGLIQIGAEWKFWSSTLFNDGGTPSGLGKHTVSFTSGDTGTYGGGTLDQGVPFPQTRFVRSGQ